MKIHVSAVESVFFVANDRQNQEQTNNSMLEVNIDYNLSIILYVISNKYKTSNYLHIGSLCLFFIMILNFSIHNLLPSYNNFGDELEIRKFCPNFEALLRLPVVAARRCVFVRSEDLLQSPYLRLKLFELLFVEIAWGGGISRGEGTLKAFLQPS